MEKQYSVEPDFAAESVKFQKHAVEQCLRLDRLPGGFYVEQKTQAAWASWIRQAAADGFTELKRAAEACKESLSLRYMESHGELYIRNDHGIVFDVHQNRSFPDIMATNKAYADLVLAARPAAVLSVIAEVEALRADLDSEMAQARDFNIEHEELKHERDQLKAEIAGLRTGYEAYEQVNAELKRVLGSCREFVKADAKARRMLDEAGEVSPLFPLRKAILASIDAAMGKEAQP